MRVRVPVTCYQTRFYGPDGSLVTIPADQTAYLEFIDPSGKYASFGVTHAAETSRTRSGFEVVRTVTIPAGTRLACRIQGDVVREPAMSKELGAEIFPGHWMEMRALSEITVEFNHQDHRRFGMAQIFVPELGIEAPNLNQAVVRASSVFKGQQLQGANLQNTLWAHVDGTWTQIGKL